MTKTLTRARRAAKQNGKHIAHDVERIIKKAMAQTASANLTRKFQHFLTDSIDSAKEKSETLHRDVSKYAHKKPYTTLGIATCLGALIGVAITKSVDTFNHTHKRR
jgi:ElaB/YqjD/DUF883 family membrane-anchored ribosome-binding protein